MATAEQAVDVLFQVALATAHGLGVAEQEQHSRRRLQLAAGDAVHQAVEQLDGRGLIAMDTGREQQVAAIVPRHRRSDFKGAFGQPVQTGAVCGELNLFRRLTAGEGQFEQFAQG